MKNWLVGFFFVVELSHCCCSCCGSCCGSCWILSFLGHCSSDSKDQPITAEFPHSAARVLARARARVENSVPYPHTHARKWRPMAFGLFGLSVLIFTPTHTHTDTPRHWEEFLRIEMLSPRFV